MTPENHLPSPAALRLKQAWMAALALLVLAFLALTIVGWLGAATLMVPLFVLAVLLPIGTPFLTVGDGWSVLNQLRADFARLKSVDTVLLAKTGTLTSGNPVVVDVQTFVPSMSADQILELVCAVEREANHPIAKAVISAAQNKQLDSLPAARDLRVIPVVGVSARVDATVITIGGPSLLTSRNLILDVNQLLQVNAANEAGRTVGYVIRDNELLGYVATSDALVEPARLQVANLHRRNKRVALLSADAQGVVKWVAQQFNLNDWFAEVLPHQRAALFEKLKAEGRSIGVVGQDFLAHAESLTQLAPSLNALDSIALRGRQLTMKLWQNRAAAALLSLAAIPLISMGFSHASQIATLTYGSVLISLSTAIAAWQSRSLKR